MVSRHSLDNVPGRIAFVGSRTDVPFPGPASGVTWRNTYIVDADGGGDYTTIQAAITAAAAESPSATDPWLVLITGGTYAETLTLSSHVHLAGMGRESTVIDLGASTLASVANCSLSNLTLTGAPTPLSATHSTFRFYGVTVLGSGTCTFTNGRYSHSRFESVSILLAGTSVSSRPIFYSCEWINTVNPSRTFTVSASTFSEWIGGMIVNDNASATTAWFGSSGTPGTGHRFVGVSVVSASGDVDTSNTFIGCSFELTLNARTQTMILDGGAQFIGCSIKFNGVASGSNATHIRIDTLTAGPILFDGCSILGSDAAFPLFRLGTALVAGADLYAMKFQGSHIKANDSGTVGTLIAVHSSGFTGVVVIESDGSRWYGAQTVANLTPTGGGSVRVRGSDAKAQFMPITPSVGTGALVTVANKPVMELNAATETCFITGRIHPPAGLLLDALLMLSANDTDGIENDTFTEAVTTDLSAHTSDTGGTWTDQSGDADIVGGSGVVSLTTSLFIGTYSVGGRNGYLRGLLTAGSGGGTRATGLVFRFADTSNYWRLELRDDSPRFRLIKRVAGVETVVASGVGLGGDPAAVSFVGGHIRAYGNGVLNFDIFDTALSTNTIVGIYMSSDAAVNNTVDNWFFYPGNTVDITVEVQDGVENEAYDETRSAATSGVHVVHRAYSYHDVIALLDTNISQGPEEGLVGVKVTLDALGTDITALYVHGLLIRTLPVTLREFISSTAVPVAGTIYR